MYCRNCGNPIPEQTTVCSTCGCALGTGRHYCPHCGQPTEAAAKKCEHCGINLNSPRYRKPDGIPDNYKGKSKLVAALLAIFLGALGIHNFYLGYTGKGLTQLLMTMISCSLLAPVAAVWALIEGILILCGKITTDGKGMPLVD